MPLATGPHANVRVIAPVGSTNRYRDITHAVDIYYEQSEDNWELVLITALPVTGFISTS